MKKGEKKKKKTHKAKTGEENGQNQKGDVQHPQ